MARFYAAIAFVLIMTCGAPLWAQCGPEPWLSRHQYGALTRVQELMAKGKNAQALKLLPKAGAARHPRMAFMRGFVLHRMGKKRFAEKAFAKAVELWACFGPAWKNLAIIRGELGRPQNAAGTAAKGYTLTRGKDPELAYLAGVFYRLAKKPKQSMFWLQKLASHPKPRPAWLSELCQAYLDAGKADQARQTAGRLLRMQPGRASSWRLLARVQMQLKSYAKAAAALETALRLEKPHKPRPGELRTLAQLFHAAGVIKKAALYYGLAFGPNPKPSQNLLLARLYLQGNYLPLAEEAALRAVGQKKSPQALMLLGHIRLRLRKYREAQAAFEEAGKAATGALAARAHLMAGHCALRREKYGQAKLAFARAMQKAPRGGGLAKEAGRALKAVTAYLKAKARG